ncbi:hypothetical protein E6O75_ATG09976 [Venturia nashicola]|uniref:Uncharacterized protein n=1 Tax=Venturia nashicola TaxID=86259 RepID=A0A4Z1P0C9_9PEZI|nr:hypothetical protein E6O75_ATG09976 [Venturia nashicola]
MCAETCEIANSFRARIGSADFSATSSTLNDYPVGTAALYCTEYNAFQELPNSQPPTPYNPRWRLGFEHNAHNKALGRQLI